MRVLLSGYKNPNYWAVTDYMEMALVELGHKVLFIDCRGYMIPGRLRERSAALEAWDRGRINARILAAARRFRPELFLVNGGHTLEPETVGAVKAAGAVTAHYTADYPLFAEIYMALAVHFDQYFVSGTDMVEHFRLSGSGRARFLPFACVPAVHKPVALDESERARYRSDVFFAGTPYPERVALLARIRSAGVDLALWGPGWDALAPDHPLRPCVRGGPLGSVEYVKAVSGCKIAFNHMGYPFRPRLDEHCNSRVFELLGCGACQIVDAKRDVKLLFGSGRELCSFEREDELLEKVRYYLDHAEEREAMGKRARAAALSAHTYRHRMAELLEACGVGGGR